MKGLLVLLCVTFLVACVKAKALKENALHAGGMKLTDDKPTDAPTHLAREKRASQNHQNHHHSVARRQRMRYSEPMEGNGGFDNIANMFGEVNHMIDLYSMLRNGLNRNNRYRRPIMPYRYDDDFDMY